MELVAVLVVVGLAGLGLLAWNTYQSNGRIVTVTSLTRKEVSEEAISFFVPGGWKVEERGRDFVFMRRGVSGCTALFFLVIFFPLGLVYLFTDWGRGRLTVSFWDNDEGTTDVELDWRNAGIRGSAIRLANWLEEQDEENGRKNPN